MQRLEEARSLPARIADKNQSRRVTRLGAQAVRASSYRFFVRRLFLGVGSAEKVAEVRSAGSPGAALTVVFTRTFPEGVSVVFVRIRMVSPNVGFLRARFYQPVAICRRVFDGAYPHGTEGVA
jgi:hypothetical protein